MPAPSVRQYGVEVLLEDAQFQNGLARYLTGLAKIEAANSKIMGSFAALASATQTASQNLLNLGTGTTKAGQSITQLSSVAQAARTALGQAGQGGQAVTESMGAMSSASATATASAQSLNLTSTALAVALGNLASSAIQSVIRAFEDMGRAGIEAVASYEMLQLSTSTLLAQQLLSSGGADSMTQAMDKTSAASDRLLGWMQDLAIKSPFKQEDISGAFQLALAFQFTGEEAQRLTNNLVNYATAAGKQGDWIQRVTLTLGQLRAEGKVTGRELRELALAGVDYNYVLAKMGKTTADVTAGTVRADDFIRTYMENLEGPFAGAAERGATKLQGLLTSMQDIGMISLRELLAPSVQALEPVLARLVSIMQESLLPIAESVGEAFGRFTQWLIDNSASILPVVAAVAALAGSLMGLVAALALVSAGIVGFNMLMAATVTIAGTATLPLLPIIAILAALGVAFIGAGGAALAFAADLGGIRTFAGNFFPGMEGDMETWGYNLILSFSNGIASGVGAVIDALGWIGQIIGYWLQPGSPPKLLPNLDAWGTAAANVYLQAWKKADWDSLKDLAGPIESALRAIAPEKDTGLIPRILGTRTAITDAINELNRTGDVTQATMNKIYAAMGGATAEVQTYVAATLELEKANRAVTAAQDELNAIEERYKEILAPIDEQLAAIDAEREKYKTKQRTAELNAILTDPRASTDAKHLAQLELQEIALKAQRGEVEKNKDAEVDAATKRLEAAKEAQRAAQAQAEAAKAALDAQTETNKLLQEQLRLLEQIEKKKKEKKGTEEAPDFKGIGGLPVDPHSIQETENMLTGLEVKLATLLAPFANLQQRLAAFGATWAGVFAGAGARLRAFAGIVGAGLGVIGGVLSKWWKQHGVSVAVIIGAITGPIRTAYARLMALAGLAVSFGLDVIEGFWNRHKGTLFGIIGNMQAWLWRTFLRTMDTLGNIVETGAAIVLGHWDDAKKDILLVVAGLWSQVEDSFNTALFNIGLIVGDISSTITSTWEAIKVAVALKVSGMWTDVTTVIGSILTWLTDPSRLTSWLESAKSLFGQIVTAAGEKAAGVYSAITDKIGEVIGWLTNGDRWTSWYNAAAGLVGEIKSAAEAKVGEAYSAITLGLGNVVSWLMNLDRWTSWYNAAVYLIGQIKSAATVKVAEAYSAITDKLDDARKWLIDSTRLDAWYSAGVNIINQIIAGILSKIGFNNQLSSAIGSAIAGSVASVLNSLGLGWILGGMSNIQGAFRGMQPAYAVPSYQPSQAQVLAPRYAPGSAAVTAGISRSVALNLNGDIHISNGMDLAQFDSHILRVVGGALEPTL